MPGVWLAKNQLGIPTCQPNCFKETFGGWVGCYTRSRLALVQTRQLKRVVRDRLCIYLSFHSVTCQFYLTVIFVLPVYPTLRGIVRFYLLTWFGFLITLSTLRIAMRRRFVKQSWVLPHSTETTFDVKSCIGSCIL